MALEQLTGPWSKNNFIFFGKLLIIALYFTGFLRNMGNIDLPLIDIIGSFPDTYMDYYLWQILFFSSSLLVFLNIRPSLFLFINGLLIIFGLMMNPMNFSHNMFFSSCLFIVFSISNQSVNYMPIQLAIVYFGATIDKFLFEHWRSGDFIKAYYENYDNYLFNLLSNYVDSQLLITTFTYSTLIVEFILIVLVLLPKTRKTFLLLGLCFHFITTVAMDNFFSMFIIAILIAYFSLLKTTINFNDPPRFSDIVMKLKAVLISHRKSNKTWFSFELNDRTYKNYYGLILNVLLSPITIILATIVISRGSLFLKQLLFSIIVIAYSGFLFIEKFHPNKGNKHDSKVPG
ncbi:MAG: hypothetical protein HRU26_12950 [Psychroserpens sp.]|nr:hypothetical protein [Psychroserpens sp.]